MDASKITEGDLLAAVLESLPQEGDSDDTKTVAEISDKLNVSRENVRKIIRKLKDSGRIECIWVNRRDIADRVSPQPAYRKLAPL